MTINPADKGWLSVPGIRPTGDRTLEEQMLGLEKALAECAGKSVLDIGCAEGLIGREFARAGARRVVGLELLASHIEVAREACKDHPQMEFIVSHLGTWAAKHPQPERFDIVLALGVIHKLKDLKPGLVWAARSAGDLLCFRSPAYTEPVDADYYVHAKYGGDKVNVPATMREEGFVDEGKQTPGPRGEMVQYWRRVVV